MVTSMVRISGRTIWTVGTAGLFLLRGGFVPAARDKRR